ncbi:MAG: hypothetical protein KBF93_14405 [Leptospiraceae bacterium]|nr:hypothetical protein [Leptospiraceae bacterium]
MRSFKTVLAVLVSIFLFYIPAFGNEEKEMDYNFLDYQFDNIQRNHLGKIRKQSLGDKKKPLVILILDVHNNIYKNRNTANILKTLYEDNPCKEKPKSECIDNGYLFTEGDYGVVDTSYPQMEDISFNYLLEHNLNTLHHNAMEYFAIKENKKRATKIQLFGVDKNQNEEEHKVAETKRNAIVDSFYKDSVNLQKFNSYVINKCKRDYDPINKKWTLWQYCIDSNRIAIINSVFWYTHGVSFIGLEAKYKIMHEVFDKKALDKLYEDTIFFRKDYLLKRRDQGMFDTFSKIAQKKQIKVILLFIGKAHEAGVMKLCEKANYSVVSIDPEEKPDGLYDTKEIMLSPSKLRPEEHPIFQTLNEDSNQYASKQEIKEFPIDILKEIKKNKKLPKTSVARIRERTENDKLDFAFKDITWKLWEKYKNDSNDNSMLTDFKKKAKGYYIPVSKYENGRLYIEFGKGNKTITRVVSSVYDNIEPQGKSPINKDRITINNERLSISDFHGSITHELMNQRIEFEQHKTEPIRETSNSLKILEKYSTGIEIKEAADNSDAKNNEVQFIYDGKGKYDIVVGYDVPLDQLFHSIAQFEKYIQPRFFELGEKNGLDKQVDYKLGQESFTITYSEKDQIPKMGIESSIGNSNEIENANPKLFKSIQVMGLSGAFFLKTQKEFELAKK